MSVSEQPDVGTSSVKQTSWLPKLVYDQRHHFWSTLVGDLAYERGQCFIVYLLHMPGITSLPWPVLQLRLLRLSGPWCLKP